MQSVTLITAVSDTSRYLWYMVSLSGLNCCVGDDSKAQLIKKQKSVTSLDQDPGVSLLGSSDSMSLMKLLSK